MSRNCSECAEPSQDQERYPQSRSVPAVSVAMQRSAVLSLVLALVSAFLTFTGLLGEASSAGKIGLIVFLVSFIITAAVTALKRQPPD